MASAGSSHRTPRACSGLHRPEMAYCDERFVLESEETVGDPGWHVEPRPCHRVEARGEPAPKRRRARSQVHEDVVHAPRGHELTSFASSQGATWTCIPRSVPCRMLQDTLTWSSLLGEPAGLELLPAPGPCEEAALVLDALRGGRRTRRGWRWARRSREVRFRDGHDEPPSAAPVLRLLGQDLVLEVPGQQHDRVGLVLEQRLAGPGSAGARRACNCPCLWVERSTTKSIVSRPTPA